MSVDLSLLYPPFAKILVAQGEDWNRKNPLTPMGVLDGLRTFGQQANLYAIGRTIEGSPCNHPKPCVLHPKGLKVTNAPPGLSWHNYGVAADEVFDSNPIKPGMQWSWDGKLPWLKFAKHAVSFGLESAAFWKTFPEFPHVQLTFGMQVQEAHELYQIGGTIAVWNALDLSRQVLSYKS